MATAGNVSLDNFDLKGNSNICVTNDRNYVSSRGIWVQDNPFYYVLPATLIQVVLSLLASRVIYFLLRPIRTPKFVCCVLGGMLLGPSLLGHNKTFRELLYPPIQAEYLILSASIGAAYSIFIVVMKMDAVTNLRNAKRTWRFGLIPFLCSYWIMTGLFYLYLPNYISDKGMQPVRIMLCVTTSVSTFPVLSESLMELNLITSELGQIALSATMLNEAMHWMFIGFSNVIKNEDAKHKVAFFLCYSAFVLFCFFIIKPAMLMIAKSTPVGKPVKELYIVLIQIGVLVIGLICDILGLSFMQGPLLAGLIMPSGPPLATTVIERTEVIISHFFLPLYFCYIGISINVFTIHNWDLIMKIQLIIVSGFIAKMLASMVVSVTYRIRLKHGLVLGLMMNIKGIIDLIIFSRMRRLKMVDEQIFAHLVFSVMGITSIASPLIEILYKPHTRLEKFTRNKGNNTRMIQNTSRETEFRIVSCVHKEGEVRSIIALLEAFNPSLSSPICVYVIHLIELLGKSSAILRRVDINKRRSWSVNYPNTNHIMRAFENYSRNSGGAGPVTIVSYINVAPYKNMHESVCNFAEDSLIPFIVIPFHENDQNGIGGGIPAAVIRDLNANFQAYAPCTVGILVDRYSLLGLSSSSLLSFHVGIFFMGGADDREALALGMRMCERENTSILLYRFVLRNEKSRREISDKEEGDDEEEENEEEESALDEVLIGEFMAKRFTAGKVAFREIAVEGSEEVFEAIRGLEGNYDLVMVGRRHEIAGFNDEEMSNFIENAEMLGMFGDMLASAEFCGGLVPVLVTECGRKREKSLHKNPSSVSHSSFASKLW